MTIQATSPTTSSASATAAAASAKPATGALTTAANQEDRFMKLLVAQMQNQDPLNPMDNAQMTSQIAQINTVGGIEKLNTTVTSLLGAFSAMQAQSATALAGHNVLVAGNSMTLADGPATGGVDLATAADTVNVDVLNSGGATVRTLSLGKQDTGVRSFSWDGLDSSGNAAPQGDYKVRVTATLAGKAVDATALTTARVQSVSNGSGGVQVDLGAAGVKAYADLKSFL
ncbi:MAG: flagellar hook assembly protein FlgD [Burkholderiaceae bacterium]|nr:flagellar hook assembly protein FlgD [Burkholderiaceae bacterium]